MRSSGRITSRKGHQSENQQHRSQDRRGGDQPLQMRRTFGLHDRVGELDAQPPQQLAFVQDVGGRFHGRTAGGGAVQRHELAAVGFEHRGALELRQLGAQRFELGQGRVLVELPDRAGDGTGIEIGQQPRAVVQGVVGVGQEQPVLDQHVDGLDREKHDGQRDGGFGLQAEGRPRRHQVCVARLGRGRR
jgi:hypothetical protein